MSRVKIKSSTKGRRSPSLAQC